MLYLKAVILAIVEGLTEFLPVSSTGHLIIVDEFLRLTPDSVFNDTFMVVIQLPAILSVALYFWKDLWPFTAKFQIHRDRFRLWCKIVAAFIPAAVLGFLFDDLIEAWLFNPITVAIALIVGGILLIILERIPRRATAAHVGDIGYLRAIGVGFIQCLAMVPGTSRSAATIVGAMTLGASRSAAAEFSFFLAIPTMLGASSLKLLKGGVAFTVEQWAVLAVGSIVSFLVAYGVVTFLMAYIRKHDFQPFGVYRIILGALILLFMI